MRRIIRVLIALGVFVVATLIAINALRSHRKTEASEIQRGRYLVQITGCNDCHTPDYAMKFGNVDEKNWLTGDPMGWQGPWGTTYAINLRLYMQDLSEEQWLQIVSRLKSRPPMPYYNLQAMTTRDLRAMYRYIRSLGPGGKPAPPYLPPGVEAHPPLARFIFPPG